MQIGLLGKANVGKSTFFSAATLTPAQTGNFPFTTISPNVGVAYVTTRCACRHFDVAHENKLCIDGTRLIPVKLVDIAGLVPGAHQGRGLGNQFLDDARQAEALIHVVDVAGATDIQGQPVPPGSHDPARDVEFVEDEFDRWFQQILLREWPKLCREVSQRKTDIAVGIADRFSGLNVKEHQVQAVLQGTGLLGKRPGDWTDGDMLAFVSGLRKMTRPILIAANKADLCADPASAGRVGDREAVPCSAEAELILRRAAGAGLVEYSAGSEGFTVRESAVSPPQRKALDTVHGILSRIGTTGVQQALDRTVFGMMGMIAVYPVEDETHLTNRDGDILPDARLLPAGSGPRDLAGTVHADIAKGFLYGIDCKRRQRIGAEHELKDGDIIKIVSAGSRG